MKTNTDSKTALCHNDRTLPTRTARGYGWHRDLPDARDKMFNAAARTTSKRIVLPATVDLRLSGDLPPVYDQGELGSCTANAIAAAYEYEQRRQGLVDFRPSRLFIYYNERVLEGDVDQDNGAQIRDGMKSIARLGCADESLWPYEVTKFATKPTADVYNEALDHQCITYARVSVSVDGVKRALAVGTPVVLGFTVYESFEDTKTNGIVVPDKGQVLGGHAVLAVGYVTMARRAYVIIRNSWGADWGYGGYCYIPEAWLCSSKNADDFWAIQSVEGSTPAPTT